MTTKEEIKNWLNKAPKEAKWMMVLCDGYDYTDYPKYYSSASILLKDYQDAIKRVNMIKFMECYDLNMDIEKQLEEHRTVHLPKGN